MDHCCHCITAQSIYFFRKKEIKSYKCIVKYTCIYFKTAHMSTAHLMVLWAAVLYSSSDWWCHGYSNSVSVCALAEYSQIFVMLLLRDSPGIIGYNFHLCAVKRRLFTNIMLLAVRLCLQKASVRFLTVYRCIANMSLSNA